MPDVGDRRIQTPELRRLPAHGPEEVARAGREVALLGPDPVLVAPDPEQHRLQCEPLDGLAQRRRLEGLATGQHVLRLRPHAPGQGRLVAHHAQVQPPLPRQPLPERVHPWQLVTGVNVHDRERDLPQEGLAAEPQQQRRVLAHGPEHRQAPVPRPRLPDHAHALADQALPAGHGGHGPPGRFGTERFLAWVVATGLPLATALHALRRIASEPEWRDRRPYPMPQRFHRCRVRLSTLPAPTNILLLRIHHAR